MGQKGQIVENKYVELKKWGEPTQDNMSFNTESVQVDTLEKDDVLVKMQYAGVNPSDIYVMKGTFPASKSVREGKIPTKVGSEGAGVVEKIGSGVTYFKKGDKFIFFDFDGNFEAYSSYIVTKTGYQVPSGISTETAGQSFLVPVTVLGLLDVMNVISIKNNEVQKEVSGDHWIAITAGTSTISRLTVQISKVLGLKTIVIIRKDDAIDELKALGADHVIVTKDINTAESLTSEIMKLTNKKGIKFGVDCIGGFQFEAMVESLEMKGKIGLYGNMSGQPFVLNARCYRLCPQFFGFNIYAQYKDSLERPQALLNFYHKLLLQNKIKVQVDEIFEFKDFLKAFERVGQSTSSSKKGKVLIKISE